VQPMKAASAAALIQPMQPAAIAGAGLVIGAFFLILGVSGVVGRLARVLPGSLAAGLQLGLGLSLGILGLHLIDRQLWLGIASAGLMLALMRWERLPVALIAILAGVGVGQGLGTAPPFPALVLGVHLPHLVIPSWAEVVHGTEYAVLPQIPLTLTNAIIVTTALTRQLFPGGAPAVTERNLAITTGLGNLLSAPFGGYLMCHGAGGIAGHVRFGARTATAPVLIGLVFVVIGLLFGERGYALLRTIPDAVLGGLLLFSGIELALSARLHQYQRGDLFLVLLMAAIGIALNPAAAFAAGLPIAYALERGWIRI
jgi:SulP family sulfate permease